MMEKHLTRIASSVHQYRSRMEIIKQSTIELRRKEREERKTINQFVDRLIVLRKPLSAYRDALIPILDEFAIDIRVETWQHDSNIVSNIDRPRSLILLAIALRRSTQQLRWQSCGSLAFYGDLTKDTIEVYEYTNEPGRKNLENKSLTWKELQEKSLHLDTCAIDDFDFETLMPYITAYLSKELHYLLSRFNPDQIMQSINSNAWNNY